MPFSILQPLVASKAPFSILNTTSDIDEISDYVKENEGITWTVEDDVKGNPTIGRGHQIIR